MLERFLGQRRESAFFALRVVAGVMFALHGVQKLFGLFGGDVKPFGSQLWLGGFIELVAGGAIALGAGTTLMALLASGTMAVAYSQFHWKFSLGEQFLPIVNRGELAVLYCFLFLYIACRGPGPFSVDAKRRQRRRR